MVDLDVTPNTFQTTYADHFIATKGNYDSLGNPLGALSTAIIVQKPTAEYGTAVDEVIVEVQRRLARYASEAALEALGTNDGIAVGDIQTLDDGSRRVCQTAGATTSTWVDAVLAGTSGVIGDGSAAASLLIDADGAAANNIDFLKDGIRRGRLQFENDLELSYHRYDASQVYVDTPIKVTSAGNTEIQTLSVIGNETLYGAQFYAASASPLVILGDNTGAPILRIRKGETNTASPLDLLSNNLRSWEFRFEGDEDLSWARYIAGSLQETNTLVLKNATGNIEIAKSVIVGTGAAASDITLNVGASDASNIYFQEASSNYWTIRKEAGNNLVFRRLSTASDNVLTLDEGNASATFIGDIKMVSDAPTLTVDKEPVSGTGKLAFTTNAAADQTNDKRFVHNSNETLTCEHYNGSTWDVVWKVSNTTGGAIGWFGSAAAQQTVTGSRGGNAALASLLTALANYGVIIDSSTA